MFCELCVVHNTCEDNQIEGANMTLFDACTARSCCSAPEGWGGFSGVEEHEEFTGGDESGVNPFGHNVRNTIFIPADSTTSTTGIDCAACDTYGMCGSGGMGYELCASKGCCDDFEDPSEDNWIPPPLPDVNTTDTEVITDQPDVPPN